MKNFETQDEIKVFGAMREEAKRFVKKFVFRYKNAKNVKKKKLLNTKYLKLSYINLMI
jgi:hypothetical protein